MPRTSRSESPWRGYAAQSLRDEGGYLLMWAIFAFVMMGGVAMLALRAANSERRSAKAVVEWETSLAAAEAGIAGTLSQLTAADLDTLKPLGRYEPGWTTLPGAGRYHAVVHRVDNDQGQRLYRLRVTGVGQGFYGGRTELALDLTAGGPAVEVPGAVTLIDGGGADVLRASFVGNSFQTQGRDTAVPSAGSLPAECAGLPTTENKLGISTNSAASETEVTGEVSSSQRDNNKGLLPGSGTNQYADQDSWGYNNGSGMEYELTGAQLQQLVDALLPLATTVGSGNHSNDFGSPTNPGIWAGGGGGPFGLTGSGKGYGVLIVTGSLSITGSYNWEGLILVVGDGKVSMSGPGSTVFGAMFVADTQGGRSEMYMAGNGTVIYSTQALCRIQPLLAAAGGGEPTPIGERAWTHIF